MRRRRLVAFTLMSALMWGAPSAWAATRPQPAESEPPLAQCLVLKTAQALGRSMPPTLLFLADEVIR